MTASPDRRPDRPPRVAVRVPPLGLAAGDSVSVGCWLVRPGDVVVEGDRLVELVSKEITFDVPSPCNGRLARIVAETDDNVEIGAVLGRIEPDLDGDD
ncbi:MAG: lipoyl domain-containing protein [Planctomycetia bacterium]